MRTILILFCLICIIKYSSSQTTDAQNMKVEMNQEAQYPGGDSELFMYIFRNVKYPETANGHNIQGEVMVSFNVEPDSSLSDIKVLGGLGYGIDEAIIEVMKPLKFSPSVQNGTKVKMNMMINVPVYIK
ncbi:MAG: energy transducer TonB [Bacteroidetes bacterium]|nr:energy transducer TonB [Bacteroidota bacterium]MBU1718475.1 energy transducer TonB [Bacteroidota bacterium]